MSAPARQRAVPSFAAVLALALGGACTLNPTIPNARVLCDPVAPKCPHGLTCERVDQASVPIGVCCRTPGCVSDLTPDQVGGIVDAAVGSGLLDAGTDGATCTPETCTGNPGGPCLEGRIECGSDSRSCKDGPKARDGTTCGSNMLCVNGVCSVCTAGTACQTNTDQCRKGVVVCDPAGCMNDAPKNAGSSCGADQVCSPAGTCIPCSTGAPCPTNAGSLCKKGAIACSSGAPLCVDSATNEADGKFCGMDKVCKTGVCTTCAAGTVCTDNPGHLCKVGVTSCGSASGCVDGDSFDAGTPCGMGQVCNGNGQCVTCQAGKACTDNPGAPCKTGVIDCTTGAERCVDAGTTAAGTTCGTNQVCNGSGTCVPCTAAMACTTNPSICRNGITSCVTGKSECVDGTPKSSSTPCSGGQMCDGNGFCGACVANQTCTGNPTPCKEGTTSCTGSMTSCKDGANRAGGTVCGVGQVCDGGGTCVACASGQACSNNPNPCKAGTTSCATGAQTCADGAIKPTGSTCGSNMVCGATGTCVACTANANCTDNPNPCKTGITGCSTGARVCEDFGNRSPGTSCGAGMVCNGNGACVACSEGQSCTGNLSACASGVTSCATGVQTCVDGAAKTPGTTCGTNQVCNANGQCTLCTMGQACAMNAGGVCVNGVTSCATGVMACVNGTPKTPGTACGTNLVCNGAGMCVTCAAGSSCGGNPSPCKSGVISCASGAPTCVDGTGNIGAGTPCGSNKVCDGSGFCGVCTSGQSCSGNPNPCFNGTASCMSGMSMCVNGTMKAAGTSCGASMVCNSSGTCVPCTAGDACTSNANVCKNGLHSCATGSQTCVDDTNKAPGVACGTNLVCSGLGTCVSCLAGDACSTNPGACRTGVHSCSTGTQTCIDNGNKAAGTNCGTNMVCNGSGTCIACTAGDACGTNTSICKNGVHSCSTGAQTCVDGGNKAAGTGCGTNMVCDGAGACVACAAGGACTMNPTTCKNGVYSCATGMQACADGSNKAGGTTCGPNMVCDGNGNCGTCTASQTCANNPNPCYTGITSCSTGTMVCNNNTQKATGTTCGTNMVCNSAGTCVACTAGGSCTGNPNQCKNGVISCMTGAQACVDGGNKADNTGCNDGAACTSNDVCRSGACSGTSYSCTATQCQSSSTCDGNGGCVIGNKPDNTGCNDGVACTAGDVCKSGACVGTPYTCTPNQCQTSATCTGTGTCAVVLKSDGTGCNDGSSCTFNDQCTNGNCAGTAYSCSPGSCEQSSTCDGSGGCSTVPKADGTNCPDPYSYCCVLGGKPRCSAGQCVYPTCCNTDTCCNL